MARRRSPTSDPGYNAQQVGARNRAVMARGALAACRQAEHAAMAEIQAAAVAMVVAGMTQVEAAEVTGLSRMTVRAALELAGILTAD